MNPTNFNCSMNDTSELRKLIVENPDLPLLVFAGEDAWRDEGYSYLQCPNIRCYVEELTLYQDEWLICDDYMDRLEDDLCNEDEYKDLSDTEFHKMIAEKFDNTEFVKAIVVYVG